MQSFRVIIAINFKLSQIFQRPKLSVLLSAEVI